MTRKRIRGGLWDLINLRYADLSLKIGNAQRVINVKKPIIVSRNSTILTNIKPSFVLLSLKRQASVNMETIAHLLIRSPRFLLSLLISSLRIQIFTCFTLRLFGALTMKPSISVINVSMHIIGKILEGNLSCTITLRSSAVTGDLKNTLLAIGMAVKTNTNAIILMDGRNLSITLKITSSINAKMETTVPNITVRIFIQNTKRDSHYRLGSVFFLKPAQSPSHRIIICRI